MPFLLVFVMVYFLFRYGEELYRNPTSVSERQYSAWSHWTLREFNELDHLFEKRLAASYDKANKYIQSFPAPRYNSVVKLISFSAGSIVLVLVLMTIVNEDLLMHFELMEGKSIIWFLGFFGALLTITRSLIPNPRAQYFDKIGLLEEVSTHLHYSPETWKLNPESASVREELKDLFPTKYVLFTREFLGLFLNPYILYFSLPKNAEELVEFFREFSVQVDGLGYVCSFALFDFERHGDMRLLEPTVDTNLVQRRLVPADNSYLQSRDAKMEKSLLNFKVNNPRWKPDENVNKFLDNLTGLLDKNVNEMSKTLDPKKSKRSSLLLSRLSMDTSAFLRPVEPEEADSESKVLEDSLYINEQGEDKKERAAASVIHILEKYRSDL
jgi:autophagy-related protein 9